MAEQKFVINKPVEAEETRYCEFKEIKGGKPVDAIKNTCDEYVVAFLNSAGGQIFWGVRDADRHAVGVLLTLRERDELRRKVTDKLNQIQPPISPTAYQINLYPLYVDETSENVVQDRFIVEIIAPRIISDDLFSTASGEVFVKTDSGKRKLTFQEIQDEIRRRQIERNRTPPLSNGQTQPMNSPPLRILYFQSYTRSVGFHYLQSPRLVGELRRRGHEVRLCWAVHEALKEDDLNVNADLVAPSAVREWQPQVLIFEDGLFAGDPRIPMALLEELEMKGSVVILEVGGYSQERGRWDEFLQSRGIEIEKPVERHHEQPVCRAFYDRWLRTSVDELREHSQYKDKRIYSGVVSIAAAWAYPLRSCFNTLVTGGKNVHIKAYGNERLHMTPFPVYGCLVEHNFLTEAIFAGGIIWDPPDDSEDFDNHLYLANLVEWLHRRRTEMLNNNGW